MENYTLSYYVSENQPFIQHRKWYEFWKKPVLIENYVTVKKNASFEGNDKDIAFLNRKCFKDIIVQTNFNVNRFQLELISSTSSYIDTGEGLIEMPKTNLFSNSESL
jgi:hypothetical protein